MTGPLQSGESLHFLDDEGWLTDTNGWPIEVEECAHFDKAMPVRALAINLKAVTIRDVTTEFEAAVFEASRLEPGFPGTYAVTADGRVA